MQLGWIDFSKTERDKVLGVIALLKEPGAVDELGIGTIRDAFSNYFFPGTSTVQTRAKYFLIVPYVLKEAGDGLYGTNVSRVLDRINEEERKCGLILIQGNKDGVIGSVTLPDHWVSRKPSDIYWNGIKELGIFKDRELSIREYLTTSFLMQSHKAVKSLGNRRNVEDNTGDDKDAGDISSHSFWTLPTYEEHWRDHLAIDLSYDEATFLRQQIETNLSGTLYAYLLKNNIPISKYTSFAALSDAVKENVPERLRRMMDLANSFNNLVYLARIRYNVILSGTKNETADEEWDFYSQDLTGYADADLDGIFRELRVRNGRLMRFLRNLQTAFLADDIDEADRLIRKQERDLKGESRAKLSKSGQYPVDSWVGGGWLDFRFTAARRMITDIYKGEGRADV